MKVYKFKVPYDAKGKTTYREAQKRSGVYLIKEDSRIVYVGYSGQNLYKTMYRHFQTWNHRTQAVVSYAGRLRRGSHRYTVRVVYCTDRQAQALEKRLIAKYHPRDNEMQYQPLLEQMRPAETRYMAEVEKIYFATQAESIECPF